jgi:hypothetical protein
MNEDISILRTALWANTTHLLLEVVEERLVSPSDHIFSLVSLNDFVFLLLLSFGRILVQGREQLIAQDEGALALDVVELDIGEIRMNTETQIAGQGPWGRGPSQDLCRRVVDELERDSDYLWVLTLARTIAVYLHVMELTSGILDILVSLPCLKVGQWRSAPGGVRHDLETAVHKVLLPQLTKYPPYRFHEGRVESFVVVVKVDPAT